MPSKKTGPRKPKVIAIRPVEVSWVDATGHSGWQSLDQAMKRKPVVMMTLGYLIENNAKYVKMVRSVDTDDDEEASVGDVFTIPKDWIQKITRLKKR